jgi:hypothetical protein
MLHENKLDAYQQIVAVLENARALTTELYLSDDVSTREQRVPSSPERAVFLFAKRLLEFADAVETNEDEHARNIAIRLVDDALLEDFDEVIIGISLNRVEKLRDKNEEQG